MCHLDSHLLASRGKNRHVAYSVNSMISRIKVLLGVPAEPCTKALLRAEVTFFSTKIQLILQSGHEKKKKSLIISLTNMGSIWSPKLTALSYLINVPIRRLPGHSNPELPEVFPNGCEEGGGVRLFTEPTKYLGAVSASWGC